MSTIRKDITTEYKYLLPNRTVNLAKEIAYSVIDFLNRYYSKEYSNNFSQKLVGKYRQVVEY